MFAPHIWKLYAMKHLLRFKQKLTELETELSLLESGCSTEQSQENLVTFGLSQESLKELSTSEIEEFILGCQGLYSRKNRGNEKSFYCWLDEMAGQMRVSAVDKSHGKLPFSIELELCSSNEIAASIKAMDSGCFTNGKLKVWCSDI